MGLLAVIWYRDVSLSRHGTANGASQGSQFAFLGDALVRFARMPDPIFKLPIVALRKQPRYLVRAARSIQAARGRGVIHTLADTESVTWHGGPGFTARASGLPPRIKCGAGFFGIRL